MKTNKDRIKEYLVGRGWVNKGEIINEIMYLGGGYGDTIGRQLRLYSSPKNPKAFLKARPCGKGTEYTLKATESLSKDFGISPSTSPYETARKLREAKEMANTIQPNLNI